MLFVPVLSARDTGDGVRRPRPGIRSVQGHLRAWHLRQHADRSGDDLRRQRASLQSPLSCRCAATIWSIRFACTPAGNRAGRRARWRTRSGLSVNASSTPRLRFKTLDELNAWLLDKCIAYAKAHRHPELGRTDGLGGVRSRATEARSLCRPVRPGIPRGAGIGLEDQPAWCGSTSNKYSVTAIRAVGRPGRGSRLRRPHCDPPGSTTASIAEGMLSSFGRGDTVYDPWHYVPVLARKPGALRNGGALQGLGASGCDRTMYDASSSPVPTMAIVQMVDILNAVLTDGLPAVEAACAEDDRSRRSFRRDVVLNILARQRDPAPPANILTPAALTLRHALIGRLCPLATTSGEPSDGATYSTVRPHGASSSSTA